MQALAVGTAASASVRGRALSTAGIATLFQGNFAQATALLTESLEQFRTSGSAHGMAICLTFLGYMAAFTLDRERVAQLLDEASALRPQLTHPVPTAYLVSFLGVAHGSQGDLEPAARCLEESLELFRALGHSRGMRQCLAFLGHVNLFRSEPAVAARLFGEGLELSRHSQDALDIQGCLLGLGVVAAVEGQSTRAARLWGASEHLRQEHGLILIPLARVGVGYDALVAKAREQLGKAAFAAAWEEGRTMPLDGAINYALEGDSCR
jgi:tetratricopeptide (TPR) repeat protein